MSRIWSLSDRTLAATLSASHESETTNTAAPSLGAVCDVSFSENARLLLNLVATAIVYNASNAHAMLSISVSNVKNAPQSCVSSKGYHLATAHTRIDGVPACVRVWDLRKQRCLALLEGSGDHCSVHFDSSGGHVVRFLLAFLWNVSNLPHFLTSQVYAILSVFLRILLVLTYVLSQRRNGQPHCFLLR